MNRLLLLALLIAAMPAKAFDAFTEAGIDLHPGAAVPLDLPFQDQSGAPVTLRGLAAGKPILLVPVLHDCPNICGVTLTGLAQAVGSQSYRVGQDFALVAFGIDPAEGPRQAADDVGQLQHSFPNLRPAYGMTGQAPDIAEVTDALGYRYRWDDQIGQYAHVAATAVLTPDGRLARWLYGLSPEPADLHLALTEAGEGRIGSWTDQILLLCYHYDPQTGRYSPVVWTVLRVGGALTAAALAAWIGLSIVRDRRSQVQRP